MNHIVALAGVLVWVGMNFLMWSWTQDQAVMFWQSLGMSIAMLAAMLWYVKGPAK